jgi:thiamine-phosphate pyrophosphorylase
MLDTPVLCLVTDRRRITASADNLRSLLELIRRAAEAGVDLVQIREPDLSDRHLFELVQRAVHTTSGTRTRIVVNDRVDVALAAGAAGVHLKSTSVPPSRVDALRESGLLVGRSVHGVDEASRVTEAGGAGYIIAGAVFETVSKPGRPGMGLVAFESISRVVTVPLLAIGGVSVERAGSVAQAGAAGLAAIGAFIDAGDDVERLVKRFRAEFDNGRSSLL